MKLPPKPPAWADTLLELFCADHLLEEIQGDLHEMYQSWLVTHGRRKANLFYLYHTIKFFRPFVLQRDYKTQYHRNIMLKHYLTTAYRNIIKHRVFSAINVAGLALGIASFVLIALYVRYELSFDKFHKDYERIYRVTQQVDNSNEVFSRTGAAYKTPLNEVLGVEEAVRLFRTSVEVENTNMGKPEKLNEDQFFFADDNFFKVFNFKILQGDERALSLPNAVILTVSTAKKYFGDQEPIGKVISIGDSLSLTVQGLMEDSPKNSHFSMDFITSIATLKAYYNAPGTFDSYWWPWLWTYVKLHPESNVAAVNEDLVKAVSKYRGEKSVERFEPKLQPLADIHLYSANTTEDPSTNGDITYVIIFSAISLLILLIACVNFTNLSLARSAKRAKEVGVRKASGAGRAMLVRQFLSESLLLSFLSLSAGLLIAQTFLPYFNDLAYRSLQINITEQLPFWLALLGIVVLTGMLAGSYPAWKLSGVPAAKVLKGGVKQNAGRKSWLQQGLIVFQFVASIALTAGTLIAFQQLDFLQSKSLGFDEGQVLTLPIPQITSPEQVNSVESLEGKLAEISGITEVSRTFVKPGFGHGIERAYEVEGMLEEVKSQDRVSRQHVGFSYFDMLNIPLVSGRAFSEESGTDASDAVVLNEAAAKAFGYTAESALGKKVRTYVAENGQTYGDLSGQVIGVVEDYHSASFKEKIVPVVFMSSEGPYSGYTSYLLVKGSGSYQQLKSKLKDAWETVYPERPLEVSLLDTELEMRYQAEQRLGDIMTTFSLLAIFIACLGLYGLASYLAESRVKEIGIRKTLGASIQQVLILFNKEFVGLIALSFVIATPLAWYAMSQWLSEFAYHVSISPMIFVAAGLLCLVIALITISYQALRAAYTNPVNALRSE